MTDIIDLVLQDHLAVAGLSDKLSAATEADEQARLFAQMKDELERHASAEEKVLYPRERKDVPERILR
jgi:hemerythrin superfamily protein